jgi:hypothetical protein
MAAHGIHALQQVMSARRELVGDSERGAHGLREWRGCSRSRLQIPNKIIVETKERREMKNQKEVGQGLFGWGRCKGGKSTLLHG